MTYYPARRKFRANPARPKKNFLWVRESFNNVSPVHSPTPNLDDLFSPFKTQFGVNFNLPDWTIWRIHIKISVHINVIVSNEANNGVHFALFVDDREVSPTINALVRPYAKQYLMWDELYAAEVSLLSGANPTVFYKEYDIKSHRRLLNIEQTLWASMVETGASAISDYSYTYSILLRER